MLPNFRRRKSEVIPHSLERFVAQELASVRKSHLLSLEPCYNTEKIVLEIFSVLFIKTHDPPS